MIIIRCPVYKYRSSSYCEHCTFPDLSGQTGSDVHEDSKRASHIVCTNNSQTSHKKCLLLWVIFLHIVQYLCILKRTKCKDVVLQSVQKFRWSESFVWCLDYKLNLLGTSCLSMYMRRHLHVPLGLCSNSRGNMELKFVKIPKHVSKTLLLAFNVGNEERFVQKQRPETEWNPTKHFLIFIPFEVGKQ